jgi:TorA maturation chaperone TorD
MMLLPPEEQERADGYALLAALLLDPEPALVAGLAEAPRAPPELQGSDLAQAWNALVAAAARCHASARDEYERLFTATGNPLLDPYQCRYLAGCHIASLCEAMFLLVSRGEAEERQEAFFERHLAGWYAECLHDIAEAPGADFYRSVARFAHAFLDHEALATTH